MIKNRAMNKRKGMSILETVVVMSSVAVALGLSTLLIQLMLRLGSDDQARLAASTALERLSREFRADAHAAAACKIEKAGAGDRLIVERGPGLSVAYRPHGSRILREEDHAGKVVDRDECVLARGATATFETRVIAGRTFVALIVHPPADKSGSTAPPFEILAAVGKSSPAAAPARKETK